ncbi:MAG: glycosyltransferase family 9 protein [Candidatus Omnitrophota bacterium]|nr:glycosyltransferase family 9 protein [Candidatus Omnitrophota bacterium]
MDDYTRPKKILIVRTDRLGDVILSTPVIKNVRLAYPEASITFMCRPYTKDVLVGNPYLDKVIVYDKEGAHHGLMGSIRFTLQLKRENFDWALILHPTTRAHVITFFAGIRLRIGWDRKNSWLLTRRIPHTKHEGLRHESDYTLDIIRALGIAIVDTELYFPVSPDDEHQVETLLEEIGIRRGQEFIVIHPSASCPSKRWPSEHFVQLARTLRNETRLAIIVVASGPHDQSAEALVTQKLALDLRGRLNVAQLGALLKRATIFISNDSGPVHVAAALHTPVISMFGRSDPGLSPRRWRPIGESAFYFHKDVHCNVCAAHGCTKSFACLAAISPEEVARKAMEIIYG